MTRNRAAVTLRKAMSLTTPTRAITATLLVRRRTELAVLKLLWSRALDAADAALQTAPAVLPDDALRGRRLQLSNERTTTTRLMAGLAHDFGLDADRRGTIVEAGSDNKPASTVSPPSR
jgi:hypothetical protein